MERFSTYQFSFWHGTVSKLCIHFSLPGIDYWSGESSYVPLQTFSSFQAARPWFGSLVCFLWKSSVLGNGDSRGNTSLMLSLIKGKFRQGSAMSSTIPGSTGSSAFLWSRIITEALANHVSYGSLLHLLSALVCLHHARSVPEMLVM